MGDGGWGRVLKGDYLNGYIGKDYWDNKGGLVIFDKPRALLIPEKGGHVS